MPSPTSSLRSNGHDRRTHADQEHCPYCLSPMPMTPSAARTVKEAIAAEEQRRTAMLETALREQFTKEMQAKQKAEIVKAVAAVTQKLERLRTNQEAMVAARVAAEKEAGAKRLDEAVQAAKLENAAERLRLESAIADLQRTLQGRRHPVDIGEPLEAALAAALFRLPEQECVTTRVPRGRAGPDLIVEIIDGGAAIARIAIEAKQHRKWSSTFVTKARSDAQALGAEWSIVASAVLPKDVSGLTVVDRTTIICDPAFVVPLVELLRRQIVTLHRQSLTVADREAKGAALLDFCGSSRCVSLLREFVRVGDSLRLTDERENAAHLLVWRRRAELIQSLQTAHTDLSAAVDAIMNGDAVPSDEGEVDEVAA